MKRFICLLAGLLLFGCMPLQTGPTFKGIHHQHPLYTIGGLGKSYADYLEKGDEKIAADLTAAFQKIIQDKTGLLHKVPPGIYADYAVLMISQGNEDAASKLAENELGLYPEAQTYIRQLLKHTEE